METCRTSRFCFSTLGFTLIEQIMVMAVIMVMAGLAVPAFHKMLERSQLQVAQMDFISGLQHGRQAAIMGAHRMLFCPSRDGHRCSGESHWEDGWLLADDRDGDHQPDDIPIRVGEGYAGKLSVFSNTGRSYVRFAADGTAIGSNATLLFCTQGNADGALSVTISNSGRIRGAPASAAQAIECAQS